MSTSALVVQGQPVTLAKLPTIREFLAKKAGITLPATVKGTPGPSTKEVIVLCKAAGMTDDAVKSARKELDGQRTQFHVDSKMVAALLAADPNIRASAKQSFNKKGESIGATVTFRKERSASVGSKVRIAQLEAQIAALTLRLGGAAVG